jgi:cyclophilin family peptidyl-prolyl cis-trans isomerase
MADSKPSGGNASTSRAGCARSGLLALGGVLVVVFLFLRLGDDNTDDEGHGNNTVPTEPRVTTTLAVEQDAVTPTCPAEDGSSPRTLRFDDVPPDCLDADATYVAIVKTNRGEFEITLDPAAAPKGVNSFVFLARYHYYDGVAFTRVLRDYLAQTGDPVRGDLAGGGDAGYLLPEEPPKAQPFYGEGSVALANQAPTPNSTGSEFFVLTGSGQQVEQLPPSYTRIGTVTTGLNVIDAIDATGRRNDDVGAPTEPTVIESIEIEQH